MPLAAMPSSARRNSISSSPTSRDRKSTRLNSSHLGISYAVFCLKKKKNQYDNKKQIQKSKYTTQNIHYIQLMTTRYAKKTTRQNHGQTDKHNANIDTTIRTHHA